jgi:hypothetical protein
VAEIQWIKTKDKSKKTKVKRQMLLIPLPGGDRGGLKQVKHY